MDSLAFRSATDLLQALRSRELSSRELLEHYLARVEGYNPQLNAVVHLKADEALARASAADAASARGQSWGPLHGLPMTIKELFEVEGFRWTAGDPQHAERIATVDSPSVQLLRDAGAVIFGVTNSPLNGLDAQTYNDVYGTTNNPWDLQRSPGGSSGGAAAAIAAGLCGLELGSDIGGSIRSPAHYSGIYGHKPTFGIVPRRRPVPPGLAVNDLSVAGPIARSAQDLELAMSILVCPELDQRVAWRVELPPPRHQMLRDYRIAAWLDDPAYPVDSAVLECLHATIEALRKAGASVDEKARPEIGDIVEAYRIYNSLLASATAARGISDEAFPRRAEEEDALAMETERGGPSQAHNGALRHRTWQRLNEKRLQMKEAWGRFFQDYDVMLMPVTQVTALKHDHSRPQRTRTMLVNGAPQLYTDQLAWVGIITMAYLPATSAPVGPASNGLPAGVQIVGPYLEDRTPIHFAGLLSEVIGGFTPPPSYEM